MDPGAWASAVLTAASIVVVAGVALGVVLGLALASYGRLSVVLGVAVAVLVPVLGPFVLAMIAAVREVRRTGREGRPLRSVLSWSIRGVPRRLRALVLIAPIAGVALLLLVLDLPVLRLRSTTVLPVTVSVAAVPGGLLVLLLGVVAVLLAAGLSFRRPSRLSAIVVAAVGAFWTALGGAFLAVAAPALALASRLSTLANGEGVRIAIQWLDTIDPRLGRVVDSASEALTASLGPAAWLAFVGGLLLESWGIVEVVVARHRVVPSAGYRLSAVDGSLPAGDLPAKTTSEEFSW